MTTDKFFRLLQKKTSLIGVCSGLGQRLPGLESGPQVLRENGLGKIFTDRGIDILDLGDICPRKNEDPQGWSLIKRVREKAYGTICEHHFLFSIGGDHSISIGTVQATLMVYPEARLVWVDAHGDINTPATSPTGNLHGMPLAALLGLFKSPLVGPLLNPHHLLIVGVRSLDPAEQTILDELNIEVITAQEIQTHPGLALEKIDGWLCRTSRSPIHLSFDVDALDPSLAPATGIRVPMGLSVEFSSEFVRLMAKTESLVAMDLVELNPLQAANKQELDQTINSVKSILAEAIVNPPTKGSQL